MDMEETRAMLKRELPRLMETDEEIRRLIGILAWEHATEEEKVGFHPRMDEMVKEWRQSGICPETWPKETE